MAQFPGCTLDGDITHVFGKMPYMQPLLMTTIDLFNQMLLTLRAMTERWR